ncbi:MAG: 3-methyl-2-oxobutanoate hydroxymethyltransferase [Phycisphaerae bacterium]|nr:3-methyl-2-oxobutanoate hydroxymethyltransferase [Phycisphaerae bacterium]
MRITLSTLQSMRERGEKFAMLTAYDYPTARIAAAAGVHSLLVGDSMGNVVLGQTTTREVPLEFMLVLAEAVRRGAPEVFLVGDLPFEAMRSPGATQAAARRFVAIGCDAVKIECGKSDVETVRAIAAEGVVVIAHLGLRPQQVLSPDGYRAQARDAAGVAALVADAREMAAAGAGMILLEAVPDEAGAAVRAAVGVPVVGCGAGPACDGFVVVTPDMLGWSEGRPPRFVPVLADLRSEAARGMRGYVEAIAKGEYPGPQHSYALRAGDSTKGSA